MNILYCIPHLYNAGGMERVLTQKVNWLAANMNHVITIVTTERVPQGLPPVHFALDQRVQVVSLDIDFDADYSKPLLAKWIGHMHRMRAYRRALTDYIYAHDIDLCISLCGKEIAFLRHLPCRTMAEVHFAKDHRQQLLQANHSSLIWSWLGRIRTAQLVRAVRPLERLVVLTEADRREWEQAGCTNITVIPNPCSLYGIKLPMKSNKSTTVLAVGRLHEQKGFDLLLKAWKPLETDCPDWQLRIVGEGPKRKALEQQINILGLRHVSLAGQSDNIVKEYTSASCFVLSSRYEGFGLVLVEAMWCGVPCVAFDCPQGPGELLADNRGWLVPAGDIAALTQAIKEVFAHPEEAQRRARKAQQYVQSTFSEAAVMPQWVKIMNNE